MINIKNRMVKILVLQSLFDIYIGIGNTFCKGIANTFKSIVNNPGKQTKILHPLDNSNRTLDPCAAAVRRRAELF